MSIKFSVGDLVHVDCLPKKTDSAVWTKSKEGSHVGIIVDIVPSPTAFFTECLAIKISNGDVITLSPNLVRAISND